MTVIAHALETAAPETAPAQVMQDPAPEAIEIARKRAADFVSNIASNTKLALKARRDELDNMMARISISEKSLSQYIGEFARLNYRALEAAAEMKEAIEEVSAPFGGNPPATLTQAIDEPDRRRRKNGSEGSG